MSSGTWEKTFFMGREGGCRYGGREGRNSRKHWQTMVRTGTAGVQETGVFSFSFFFLFPFLVGGVRLFRGQHTDEDDGLYTHYRGVNNTRAHLGRCWKLPCYINWAARIFHLSDMASISFVSL